MALNPNALTSLAMAKAYLKIPTVEMSQDAIVEFFINAASQDLESETDRFLKKRSAITEFQDGRKQSVIALRQYPVASITSLHIDADSSFPASTLIPATDYEIADDLNGIVLKDGLFSGGERGVKIVYAAGFDPIPSDLEHACLWLVFWYAKIRDAQDIGRPSKSKEGETISYAQSMPGNVRETINRYKRTECFVSNASTRNG